MPSKPGAAWCEIRQVGPGLCRLWRTMDRQNRLKGNPTFSSKQESVVGRSRLVWGVNMRVISVSKARHLNG